MTGTIRRFISHCNLLTCTFAHTPHFSPVTINSLQIQGKRRVWLALCRGTVENNTTREGTTQPIRTSEEKMAIVVATHPLPLKGAPTIAITHHTATYSSRCC